MDITNIVKAIFGIVTVIVSAFLVPYIKQRTNAEQQKEINEWVRIAVRAAEQIYAGTGRGEEKKEYVIEWLYDHDLFIDLTQIDALIEAAVYELNSGLIVINPEGDAA